MDNNIQQITNFHIALLETHDESLLELNKKLAKIMKTMKLLDQKLNLVSDTVRDHEERITEVEKECGL